MANEQIKISKLTEVTSVTGNEEMPVVQSGSTKKMSLNQAKDFIGGAGVIIFPEDILELKQDSTSDEIFTAFGGKTNYNNTISKIKTESLIKIGDGPLYAISLVIGASYTDEDNSRVVIQSLSLNVSFYLQVTVTNGTAKAIVGKWDIVDAAKILTKDNTTAYTPTRNYHPATKKYADASSLYKVYNLGLNVIDRTGVLLLWEAEKDEYDATVYRGIMMGSLCTIPLNGITQSGTVPLVSMSASFRKVGDNNETVFMYARGSSNIRVAPATVIYDNKDYIALQVEVNDKADIMNFVGYFDRPPLLTWVPYLEETGSGTVILNEEINSNIDVFATKEFVSSSDVLTKTNTSAYTPTKDYHPATKSYVDGRTKIYKYEDGRVISALLTPTELKGHAAVIPYLNSIFGGKSNCKDIISKLAKGEISSLKFIYEFEDPDTNHYSCRTISSESFYAFVEEGNGEWKIQFVHAGKLVIIDIVESILANYKFIVKNLVSSDNLTTLTKKSIKEYSAIINNDANTVYCVTD